ncbi:transporter substrate-binding domain-containing protein [Paralysiella testudinis]|uniref:Transporter substrate-binding domain-containing protein n=1 Tax=Paralysiella testudinis TaxID=2809020 RepID=A0A892ZG05_9NEIS|nr:transporter substrate-binding domain-containing protein [Paralysiella testudinis]QRQ81872.1 transporter substrate-binding domain-containing protein [Paralysiella testudinis]
MQFVKTSLVAIALSILLAACGQKAVQESTTQAASTPASAAANANTYLVATDATYAPFEFRDEQGLIVGYDIDLFECHCRRSRL